MHNYPTGLTTEEVEAKQSAGLSNQITDSASPSYGWIVIRNIFNLINIFLFPLLVILFYFQKYQDVFVMSTFAVINSLVGMWDEIRIKRRLDKIQVQFAKRVTVIRNGHHHEILASDLVLDDVVIVHEGEGVPTDGVTLVATNLQVDESLLTGESNYITKDVNENLIGGSFVISGECIYKVSSVGKDSYVNKLGVQSKNFRKERSQLQKIGNRLTIFFVVASVIFGLGAFFSARSLGQPISEAVVPLTTVVSLIIPQTLIFLFTFTFSISVLKLSQLGVLVQRGSAVESLAKLDVLCFDKTGTITSGNMQTVSTKYWNVKESEIAKGFNYLADKVFGRNKTFETVAHYFATREDSEFHVIELTQIPFNSKTKVAKNQFKISSDEFMQFVYGATPVVIEHVKPELKSEVLKTVEVEEKEGRRVILGVVHSTKHDHPLDTHFVTDKVWMMSLKEDLNPGVADTIKRFQELGTELKIISGDSMNALTKALADLGLDMGNAIDLSSFKGDLVDQIDKYAIFARAKPEDKLTIIKALQAQGKQVGMVGDGANDVLALKLSNLSIAMESGAKIAQDVSDVVLLKNNFEMVPRIIFEGDNVIANLKFMNLLFLNKTFHAILFAIFCIAAGIVFPLLPSAILIYSFLATSLPSYVIAFFRREVSTSKKFWQEVLPDSTFAGIVGALVSLFILVFYRDKLLSALGTEEANTEMNTLVMYGTFAFGLMFSIYELWKNKYMPKWWQPVITFVVLYIIGFVATLIPLIAHYYTVYPIGVNRALELMVPAVLGFVAYIFIQVCWDMWYKRVSTLSHTKPAS